MDTNTELKTEHELSQAQYISEAETRLSNLIDRQFKMMVTATLLPTAIILLVLVVIPFLARSPRDIELINQLNDSNRQLADVSQALLKSSPTITSTHALEVVLKQLDLHEQASKEITELLQQPKSETQSLMQVVGSAAILALLGALGLQRLQNIDTEINNVRESVFAQSEARAQFIQENVQSQIVAQVQHQFRTGQEEIQNLANQARQISTELQNEAFKVLSQVTDQVEITKTEVGEVKKLVEMYPWLKSKEKVETISRLNQLTSVEQAQALAEEFRRSNDKVTSRKALEVIIEKQLPGNYADFHKAFSEAMHLEDYQLALKITELGLLSSPEQFDLIADKTRVLTSLGKAKEAREFIEEWKERKPDEFSRSWRPIVFYDSLFDALEITPEAIASLERAFHEVTSKLPFEIKPWSEYAELMMKLGKMDQAEEILRKALELNPLSQQLNYVLGDLLLRQGKIKPSLEFLEATLRLDYQDQWQHDINQFSVRGRLAQAYEANGNFDEAIPLYQSIAKSTHSDAFPAIKEYANNRLSAIALLKGEVPEDENISLPSLDQLLQIIGSRNEESQSPDTEE